MAFIKEDIPEQYWDKLKRLGFDENIIMHHGCRLQTKIFFHGLFFLKSMFVMSIRCIGPFYGKNEKSLLEN